MLRNLLLLAWTQGHILKAHVDVAKFVQYLRNEKSHIYYIVAIYSVKGLQVLAVRLKMSLGRVLGPLG